MGTSSLLKSYFEEHPTSIALLLGGFLAVANIALQRSGNAETAGAANIGILGLVILAYSILTYRKKRYAGIIETLRNALIDYHSLMKAEDDSSPIRIMNACLSDLKSQPEARRVLSDQIGTIHAIVMDMLQDCISEIKELNADIIIPDVKDNIEAVANSSWKILGWYYSYVVKPVLTLAKENPPEHNYFRESLARFRTRYDEALKAMSAAREKANTCGLGLDTRIDPLRVWTS